MKKTINVNGTNFTVDVNITSEDRYNSIDSDYKKLLYLLGQVSTIGAKLDSEFTVRNNNLKSWAQDTESGLADYIAMPTAVKKGLKELKLTTREKNNVIDTINSTMSWYKDLKNAIERL